jgi:hypothetical protein
MNFRRRGPKQTSEYQHAIERFDCYFDFAPTAASYPRTQGVADHAFVTTRRRLDGPSCIDRRGSALSPFARLVSSDIARIGRCISRLLKLTWLRPAAPAASSSTEPRAMNGYGTTSIQTPKKDPAAGADGAIQSLSISWRLGRSCIYPSQPTCQRRRCASRPSRRNNTPRQINGLGFVSRRGEWRMSLDDPRGGNYGAGNKRIEERVDGS